MEQRINNASDREKKEWKKPGIEVLNQKQTLAGPGEGSETFCSARTPTTSVC